MLKQIEERGRGEKYICYYHHALGFRYLLEGKEYICHLQTDRLH